MNSIQFEKYNESDFDLFFDLVKDDEVMKYIFGRGMTKDEARKKFDSILVLNQMPQTGYFKVIKDGIRLGDCKLVDYKKDETLFEIGYLLSKEFWGKGYGTQICRSMLDLAGEINPSKSIIGIIDPENIVSRKLLEKFGFISYFSGIEDGMETEKLILKK